MSNGGIDGANDTYSANALAAKMGSASMPSWNFETFALEPIFIPDAVAANGQTIELPQGSFTSIQVLGAEAGGSPVNCQVTVNYVGGGSTSTWQIFSDWKNGYTGGGTTALGESIAAAMTTYNTATGTVTGNRYLYGYIFSINASNMVSSIVFSGSGVVVLAIDEINQAQQTFPSNVAIGGRKRPIVIGLGGGASQGLAPTGNGQLFLQPTGFEQRRDFPGDR